MLDVGRSKRPERLTLSDCPLLKSDLERYVATLRARGHATGEGALRPSSIYEVQWTLGSYVSELLGDGVDPLETPVGLRHRRTGSWRGAD